MSERWPRFGSKQPTVESEASSPSSPNGADPGDPATVADKPEDEPIVASTDRAGESMTAEPITAAGPVAEATEEAAAAQAEEAAAAQAEEATAGDDKAAEEVDAAEPSADEGALFLAELVRAMRTTAGLERTKIAEDTERRRQDHIDQVRARQGSEADRMRELAGEDKKAIQSWADGETKRIQLERERREKELNADLEMSLAGHRAKVDREIEGVEAAIATYQAEVDAFFEALDRETDPVLIAQHAARRPIFPKLDATAETPGSTETPMVGVMDAEALAARIGSWPGASAHAEGVAGVSTSDVGGGEAREPAGPVVGAAGSGSGSPETLLETVPAVRPMSWLRRGGNGGDDGPSRDS
jgi:hypothetical protein